MIMILKKNTWKHLPWLETTKLFRTQPGSPAQKATKKTPKTHIGPVDNSTSTTTRVHFSIFLGRTRSQNLKVSREKRLINWRVTSDTLPETSMAPENTTLGKENHLSGSMLIFAGVSFQKSGKEIKTSLVA